MTTEASRRLKQQLALTFVSGVLFLAFALRPDWIEFVFGIEVDEDNGLLEWAIALVPLAVAVTSAALAYRTWRRTPLGA